MVLTDMDYRSTKTLAEGTRAESANGKVAVVIGNEVRETRLGSRMTGGLHIHKEMESPAVYSVRFPDGYDKRGRYIHVEPVSFEVSRDAVTLVCVSRWRNKYGGGRGFITAVFAFDQARRVRGWPSKPLTAAAATKCSIGLPDWEAD